MKAVYLKINRSQYARQYIFQNGENKERFEIECDKSVWQQLAECFGTDATVIREDRFNSKITVKIVSIPSVMRSWVLGHINECEVIGPKKFRDEIQKTIMEAYRKYC